MVESSPTASLASRQEDLVAALSRLRDPQARFAWAVEQARRRTHLPDALRVDANRVEGCLIRLWFVPAFREGRCWFKTDSDAVTLRAISGFLCDLASGSTPEELVGWQPDFLERLGLLRQLADNRRATVARVAERIRAFAAGACIGGTSSSSPSQHSAAIGGPGLAELVPPTATRET